MATPKKTPARPSRSRTETKAQFSDIQEAREGIEATDAKSAEATKSRAGFVRQAVHGMTVEGVIKAAADIKLAASSALDDVTEKLAGKVEELRLTEEALTLAKAEFTETHDLDIVATTIDILIEEHAEQKAELEKEILVLRAQWAEDLRNHDDGVRRRNAELQVSRQRENDEFEYKKRQERQAKEDEFSQGLIARQRSEKDRQVELEKSWTAREMSITSKEADVQKLQEQVAAFPEILKKDIDRSVAIATSSLKKDLTQEFALKEKDLNTSLTIEKAKGEQLAATNHKQEEAIVQLQARIQELQKQVVETASKAIDGSARTQAFNDFIATTKENGATQQQKRGS